MSVFAGGQLSCRYGTGRCEAAAVSAGFDVAGSDDHPRVLRGVDLQIPCGSAVALVGLTGAGKSTLVTLLCRMYDPTRGQILWDGTDLRDIPPESLRERS